MEKELPKNWVETELGNYAILKNGYAFKSNDFQNDGIPVVRISNIKDFKIDIENSICVDESKLKSDFIVSKGDVLIAMSGATTGKYGVFEHDIIVLQNQRVGNLKPVVESLSNKRFILYLLGSLKEEIEEKAYGAAQPNISPKLIESINIFLPPLAEQNRIVAKLDALFAQLETIKTSMAKVPLLLKDFRQQVLTQAVTGKLTEDWRKGKELEDVDLYYKRIKHDLEENYQYLVKKAIENGTTKPRDQRKNKISDKGDPILKEIPNDWKYFRAEELFYLITDGVHFKPKYTEEGVKFLSVKNVRPFRINSDECKFISNEDHLKYIQRCNPENGDILYTKVGATYGYAAKIDLNYDFSIFVSLALLKPSKLLNSSYLELLFNSPVIFNQANFKVSGIGVPDLHLIEIRDFKIPLPSFKEQQEIVSRVESLFAKADAIEKQYETLKAKIDSLPQAILHKAFKGELSEQLDSDGDARELLREIEGLKEAGKTLKSKKTKSVAKKVKSYVEKDEVLGW